MKVEYDTQVDAAYIYLEHPLEDGAVDHTISLTDDIHLDVDAEGKILGVEILNAHKHLRAQALQQLTEP